MKKPFYKLKKRLWGELEFKPNVVFVNIMESPNEFETKKEKEENEKKKP